MTETSAVKIAEDLLEFCKANQELRFWQAVRTWISVSHIYVSDGKSPIIAPDLADTFYWKGKSG